MRSDGTIKASLSVDCEPTLEGREGLGSGRGGWLRRFRGPYSGLPRVLRQWADEIEAPPPPDKSAWTNEELSSALAAAEAFGDATRDIQQPEAPAEPTAEPGVKRPSIDLSHLSFVDATKVYLENYAEDVDFTGHDWDAGGRMVQAFGLWPAVSVPRLGNDEVEAREREASGPDVTIIGGGSADWRAYGEGSVGFGPPIVPCSCKPWRGKSVYYRTPSGLLQCVFCGKLRELPECA